VKPLVDTSEPMVAQLDHVRANLKKEQLLEQRYSEIDRENHILLKKMSGIMRQQAAPPLEKVPGPLSLNRDARKKELLRITKENQSILKRIQRAQPVYNHVEWEGHNRRNMAYLKNCAEYPLVLRTPRRAAASSQLVPLGEAQSGQVLSGRSSATTPRSSRLDRLDLGQPDEDAMRCVWKEGRRLGESDYIIEMSTDGRTLTISASSDTQRTLELVIQERNHRTLYREANGDYEVIAQRLRIDGDQLVLDMGSPTPTTPHEQRPESSEEMDADTMIVSREKSGTAGSVNAEVGVNSRGEAEFRLRGLTPSSGRTSPEVPR